MTGVATPPRSEKVAAQLQREGRRNHLGRHLRTGGLLVRQTYPGGVRWTAAGRGSVFDTDACETALASGRLARVPGTIATFRAASGRV